MRYQRQSDVPKKGNGTTHDSAVLNVKEFFILNRKKKEWEPIEELLFRFNEKWIKKDSRGKITSYRHSYDIGVVDDYFKPVVMIEVDGEKHSKPRQIANDQRAERYADEILKVQVIRLNKIECNGLLKDRQQYLKKELKQFLK